MNNLSEGQKWELNTNQNNVIWSLANRIQNLLIP